MGKQCAKSQSARFLRRCETRLPPPNPDQLDIENCKQLLLLIAFTTRKIATHSTDIIFAVGVAFFSVVNVSRREKSCLQFLISTAVFHMLLNTKMLKKKNMSETKDPKLFIYRQNFQGV